MATFLEILKIFISFSIGGGIVTIATIPFIRRMKKAEANFSELDTFQKRITSYNVMISDMDMKINELVKKSASLEKQYVILLDKYNKLKEKYIGLQKEYRSLLRKYNALRKKNT